MSKLKNQLRGTHTQIIQVSEIEDKENKGVGNQRNNARKIPRTERFVSILSAQCELLLLFSCSVVSNSLRPLELQPTRLFCPRNFLGKNTGAGCHFLLQGNLPNLRIETRSPTLQADSLSLSHLKRLYQVLNQNTFSEVQSTVWGKLSP